MTAPLGSVPSLTAPIPAAHTVDSEVRRISERAKTAASEPVAVLEDISATQASRLMAPIPTLVADLRADYSNEHIVFDSDEATASALTSARQRIGAMRDQLGAAIDGRGGEQVDRVCDCWHGAVVELVPIEVQREHWAAPPQSVTGAWKKHLASTPDGEMLAVSFGYVSRFAIGTQAPASELETTLLPGAIESLVATNDWGKRVTLERELTAAELAKLLTQRDALLPALAEVCAAFRIHYCGAYDGALGALTDGDSSIRDRTQLSRDSVAELWLDPSA